MNLDDPAVIERIVESQLTRIHPGGSILHVVPGRVRKDEFSWRLLVRPDKEPPKMHEYYELLAEVEEAIEQEHGIKTFLVPTDPAPTEPAELQPA